MVKSTEYCYRGAGFNSQHLHSGSQPSVVVGTFGGAPPSSQINTWKRIITYTCLALDWFISNLLSLT